MTYSNVDTDYYLYEMSDNETTLLLKQIGIMYKDKWEQTRIISASFTGQLIELPWDNEEEFQSEEKYTSEDIMNAFNKYGLNK